MRCHAVISVAAICVAYIGVSAQSPSRQATSDNRPLVEQIRPADEHLRLEAINFPPSVATAPPGALLTMMADLSDAILIIRVEGKKPELTERQNWIRSLVSARVERVVKPISELSLSQGSRIAFWESGGIMQIGHTTVEAVLPWAIPYAVGKRYLVFVNVTEEGQFILGPSSSYEDVSGLSTARRLMTPNPSGDGDEIEHLGLDGAAAQIEAHLQSKR